MPTYCIIETENGWTVAEHPSEVTAEGIACRLGGIVIDPGPFESYEEACDALVALQGELDETEPSDVPGTQSCEGRFESPG